MIYLIHPESCCAFAVPTQAKADRAKAVDGLVEEVSKEEWLKACVAWGQETTLTCGRCYEEVEELFEAPCNEKPEKLLGAPIGQYHCPDCGAMVMAGVEHFDLCARCRDGKHPAFDPA